MATFVRPLPLKHKPLAAEQDFYLRYQWALNVYPTVREMIAHLKQEARQLEGLPNDWRFAEVATNVFLLSSSILNTFDDYVLGPGYDFSKAVSVPFVSLIAASVQKVLSVSREIRGFRMGRLRKWRENLSQALDEFLRQMLSANSPDAKELPNLAARLTAVVSASLPQSLLEQRLKLPPLFKSRDLAHFDYLRLADRFKAAFPDSSRPVLIVGFRTAGSYAGPLICAYLKTKGYADVYWITIRPRRTPGPWERRILLRSLKRGCTAVLVDEPPHSGGTVAKTVKFLWKLGYPAENIAGLFPIEPAIRTWQTSYEFRSISKFRILTLQPEERYKNELMAPGNIELLLREYFESRGYETAKVVSSHREQQLNEGLLRVSEEKADNRLKRIYEVELRTNELGLETRYVLAKSVGWGWFGYHAFIAAHHLAQFVPPVLGLRDGILFTEWLPQSRDRLLPANRERMVSWLASYISTRVRRLGLGEDPVPLLALENRQRGSQLLADMFSAVYGSRLGSALKRPSLQEEVSRKPCPFPTYTDARFRRVEWIRGDDLPLKTDFEHHGAGKAELTISDPTYDLAEAILHFGLSREEEDKFVAQYIQETSDRDVVTRLFHSKLLAGTWSILRAQVGLSDTSLLHRHPEFHQQYWDAWNFLILQMVRFCGSLCFKPGRIEWRTPVAAIDVDGVIDRMVFNFPGTTAAGIQALSLLHAHGYTLVLNSARSLMEVKAYCKDYGFAGGIAEYGAAAWDAVNQQEQVLVSPESLGQLKQVESALREIPGVFLNETCQYSLRAFTYQRDRTRPLPAPVIQTLITNAGLDRLRFHQTDGDTAIIAKETDKGKGLQSLLALVGLESADTVAIGDSEADLPMFAVAKRSFAPSQIGCRQQALALGCRIVEGRYQPGLRQIARLLSHPDRGSCAHCKHAQSTWPKEKSLIVCLLETADLKRSSLLLRAVFDRKAYLAFRSG